MALLIEDGTGVNGANSYVTVAEARDYATNRGLTLPLDDEALKVLLIKAAEDIELARLGPFKGDRTYINPSVDTMSWPRTGVVIDGIELGSTQIPVQLKKAQCQLAVEIQTVDPTPTISGQLVKREKVDVIETEYAIDYKSGQKPPQMTKVNMLLQPLLRNNGMLRVSRA